MKRFFGIFVLSFTGTACAKTIALNLDDILQNHYTANYSDNLIAQSQASQARQQFWFSLLKATPSLSASYTHSESPASSLLGSNKFVGQQTQKNLTLSVTQPLTPLLTHLFESASDQTNAQIAHINQQATAEKVLVSLAKVYLKSLSDRETCKIYNAQQAEAKKQYEATKQFFESGTQNKNKVDVLKMLFAFHKAQKEYDSCLSDFENDKTEMKKYLGLQSEDEIQLPETAQSLFQSRQMSLPSLTSFLNKVPENLDVRSAKLQATAASQQEWGSASGYLPQVNFLSSFSYLPTNSGQSNLDDKTFSYGISLDWNFWDRGTFLQKQSQAAHLREQAEITWEQKNTETRSTIQQSYESLKNQIQSATFYENSVPVLKEAFEKSQVQYRLGLISAADLNLTQDDFSQAQIEEVQTNLKIDEDWLDLQIAAGEKPGFH